MQNGGTDFRFSKEQTMGYQTKKSPQDKGFMSFGKLYRVEDEVATLGKMLKGVEFIRRMDFAIVLFLQNLIICNYRCSSTGFSIVLPFFFST